MRGLFCTLIAIGLGSAVAAQQPAGHVDALKSLTLEELASLDVTTAGRRLQRIADVAAAVTVVTGEDLRRYGSTTIAESLRLADGLHVARLDGHSWAVSARGFNITTSNKMLTMMDGRSLWTPLFGGVLWDEQDTMVNDIDRIEVVRGPGGTLWGANAINGVINIVTRPATDTIGTYSYVAAGNEDRLVAGVRHGRAIGTSGAWRAYAKVAFRDGNRLENGAHAGDDERRVLVGARADWRRGRDAFVLQGDAYKARLGLFESDDTPIHGGYVRSQWTRAISAASTLQVQGVVDYTSRHVVGQFEEQRLAGQVDVQHRFVKGRHDLVTGGDVEFTHDDTAPSPVLAFEPNDRHLTLFSAFVQDEIAIAPGRFWLTPGLRLLKNSYTGVEAHPALRGRWRLDERQMLWGAVSRAVRLPTRFDRDLRISNPGGGLVLAGSDAFNAETVVAVEGGYRAAVTPRLSVSASVFRNQYDELRSLAFRDDGVVIVRNDLNGRSTGLHVSVQAQPAPWLRVHGSYTRLSTSTTIDEGAVDLGEGVLEFNDPDHQFAARAYANLPGGFELDGFLRAVSALPHPEVPAYSELDARFGWVSRSGHELALIGRNLLPGRHAEFADGRPQRHEFERALLLRSTWRF